MISELMKRVMQECELRQVDLAEVLGVSLSRVKAMTSGRVQKLTREESQALIDKLGIRAAWLVTGEGNVFGKDEAQDEFVSRQQAITRMNALLAAMPMSDATRARLAVLMTGDPEKDGPLIAQALSAEAQGSNAPPALTPRKAALLDNYDATSEEGKKIIEAAAFAASKQSGKHKAA